MSTQAYVTFCVFGSSDGNELCKTTFMLWFDKNDKDKSNCGSAFYRVLNNKSPLINSKVIYKS
jgi:hypothetical protein